ncbi:unnamed protein product, partial [Discosporangium mesarthrocarpum]
CPRALQTAFDLLGELCKGNYEVLELLESGMTTRQLQRFLKMVVGNLIDSNVFIRSLVLSVEHRSIQAVLRQQQLLVEDVAGDVWEHGDTGIGAVTSRS